MIDESTVVDFVLAAVVVACCVVGLAIVTRRPTRPPIPARTLHRINQHIEERNGER